MSIEEIINGLQKIYENDCDSWMKGKTKETIPTIRYYSTVIRETITLLRTHPDTQPNEPLTLEDIAQIVGNPVYDRISKEWFVIFEVTDDDVTMTDGTTFVIEGSRYSANRRFYRRPPKEEAG